MRSTSNENIKETLYDSSEPFLLAHPEYNLNSLPSWLRDNIDMARVYGNKKKGVILPDGRKYHLDNSLNDLTGREWTFFINSVFATRYSTNGKDSYAHHIRKIHPIIRRCNMYDNFEDARIIGECECGKEIAEGFEHIIVDDEYYCDKFCVYDYVVKQNFSVIEVD